MHIYLNKNKHYLQIFPTFGFSASSLLDFLTFRLSDFIQKNYFCKLYKYVLC
jgi:hypothetical protein